MRISYWSSDVCSSSLTAWAWHANRGASFGLRQLQRRLQQREQALELAGHQREAGIELGTDVLGLRAFELVDHAVEELQLADDQVLAEHERDVRSEEHTSELQSLMRISYAVFCLKKKNTH